MTPHFVEPPVADLIIDRIVDLLVPKGAFMSRLERKATSWNDSERIIINNIGLFCYAGNGV